MIEKLKPINRASIDEFLVSTKYAMVNYMDWCEKVDELIDAFKSLEKGYCEHYEYWHQEPVPKPQYDCGKEFVGSPLAGAYGKTWTPAPSKLAKLEMLRACLDDLEDEIRQGSI